MKVRLNKKTQEELSTNPVLGSLQTKQKQVEENITTCIDEPFLKPENIRHGINIAGVGGKYIADLKTLSIYNENCELVSVLASTEPSPKVKQVNNDIILTNAPFDSQYAYSAVSDTSAAYLEGHEPMRQDEEYTLDSKNTKVICVNNYSTAGVSVAADYGNVTANFYEVVPEMGDYVISDTKSLTGIVGLTRYSFDGYSYDPNCYIDVIDTNYTTILNIDSSEFINGIRVSSIRTGYESNNSEQFEVTVHFEDRFTLQTNNKNCVFALYIEGLTGAYRANICKCSDGTLIVDPDPTIWDVTVSRNAITFKILVSTEDLGSSGAITVYVSAAKLYQSLPETLLFEQLGDAQPDYPYYVELPVEFGDSMTGTCRFDDKDKVSIGETSKMFIKRFVSTDHLYAYVDALESAAPNISKVSDVYFGNSHIITYETFSQRITVQYIDYNYNTITDSKVENHGELRVIEDSRTGEFNRLSFSNTGLSPNTDEYAAMPDFTNSAFMMIYDNAGLMPSYERWPGCMGFVYRLADGSFFIIDGGHGGLNAHNNENLHRSMAKVLMNALRAYSNDEQIRIAGWLLTHAHQDHIGIFCEFFENSDYKNKVSIDKVIYSLPPEKFSCFDSKEHPYDSATLAEFKAVLDTLRTEKKTELIKAHMGQEFVFDNLKLNILTAPENVYMSIDPEDGNKITDLGNLNDTSIVCKVSYCSKDIIFMSDAHAQQMRSVIIPVLLSSFAGIQGLQVAHHGYTDTGSEKLYEALNDNTIFQPEFILWPVCYEHFSGKQVNGNTYQETSGTDYEGVYYREKNAAIKNFQAIYPENNYSMVTTPSTIGNWTFTPVDFVDPCSHGTSFEYRYSTLGNNKHLCECYCSDCRSYVYSYEEDCIYLDDDTCNYCRASKPACEHTYDYRQISDGAHEKYCTKCGYVAESYISCTKGANDTCEFCNNDFCHYCTNAMGVSTCSQCGNNYCDEHGNGGYCKNCSGDSGEPKCYIDGCTNTVYSNCNYCQNYFCEEHFFDTDLYKCINCGTDSSKTPFTCAHCGSTHYYEDGYSYCYECGDTYGDSCSASCPNAEPECTHTKNSYSYYQDSDSSHRIYCNECSRDIATGVSCTVNAHGHCEFCNNDFCTECGSFYPDTTCYVCGSPICSNCAAVISGNDVCPDCADSKYRVTFTQANGNYTSWINNDGVATDTMPYYTVGSNGSVSTVFMLDMYGPTSIKAYVTEGAANVTVTRVAGHNEQFTVTVSNVLGHTNVMIEAV